MNRIQNLLRSRSIRVRMLALVALLIGLLVAGGAAAILGGAQLKALGAEVTNQSIDRVRENGAVRDSLHLVRLHEKDMVIDYADGSAVQLHQVAWLKALANARKSLEAIQITMTGDDRAAIDGALKALVAYADASKRVLGDMQSGGFDNAKEASDALKPAKAHIEAVEKTITGIGTAIDRGVVLAQADLGQTLDRAGMTLIAALALAVAVTLPLTWLIARSILTPIAYARKVARSIANGDLSMTVRSQGRDEATELVDALAQMQQSLRGLVGQMRATADGIQVASAEVASGNQDLSGRTESAASTLQQTAGATLQLSSTVRQSADAASQANQLAASACSVAHRGGEAVTQVVGTMQEIEASSRRIADITSVVDGIAFQTNILALNAAVEAARAGEQGRGFAVVAAEVRNLAQRSAEAAREIKSLIGASVERIGNGTRLAKDAGTTMTEIVASVQRVSDIIGEIAAAGAEQSQGIGQINQSVGQLEQVTQQNAALVEESAAAAESLREQALRLGQVVSTFRLTTDTATASSPTDPIEEAIGEPIEVLAAA